ncbi:PEGA domain-containing protein [candidate division KSB1 bacterium]|nr:PEGA domain-containing protein [candidate division KSB1 bacterium]
MASTSEPSGAAIELDGKVVGNTPFKIEQIKPGQHQIVLSKPGYSDKTTSVDIEAGQTKPLKVQLTAFLGKIGVLVRPYGSIYVDDELKKKDTFTPYTEELQVGQHKIRAVHPTLGTFEKYVEVQANEQVEISFDFNQKVTVTILSQDETGKAVWAGIYIDNKDTREVTPKEVQLSPGQYKILVRRKGYSAEGGEKVINVKHGMELVKFILRRLNN